MYLHAVVDDKLITRVKFGLGYKVDGKVKTEVRIGMP